MNFAVLPGVFSGMNFAVPSGALSGIDFAVPSEAFFGMDIAAISEAAFCVGFAAGSVFPDMDSASDSEPISGVFSRASSCTRKFSGLKGRSVQLVA